jgi:hypothetical protein
MKEQGRAPLILTRKDSWRGKHANQEGIKTMLSLFEALEELFCAVKDSPLGDIVYLNQ